MGKLHVLQAQGLESILRILAKKRHERWHALGNPSTEQVETGRNLEFAGQST